MPAGAPSAQVTHSAQPDVSTSHSRRTLPPDQDSGKENTFVTRPGLRVYTLPSSQSPFSEINAEQDRLASRNHFPIPIPAASASGSHSRGSSDNPQALRSHVSLRDWAGPGMQASSSLQSLQSLGDSLPSLGDWATMDAAARYRDLSRDSPDFGFSSNGSSPSGSSPQSFGRHMAFRSKPSRSNASAATLHQSQQNNNDDADFSFSLKQTAQPALHGIAEEHSSPDSDGDMLLRSLQNVSAMADDQDGASSLLMLHKQASPKAEQIARPRSPGIKRARGSDSDNGSGSKSPRLLHAA